MLVINKILNKLSNPMFKNSLWMMSEKLISIFGLIFVTSFVAKYIGPENFGKLTFVTSIFAIVQTIALMGTENIIFQKTAKNRKFGEYLIFASKKIRDYIYKVFCVVILVVIYIYTDRLTFIFGFATGIAIYFAVHDVYSIYFNAILESKINAYCNIVALIISLLVRYLIVFFKLPIEFLALPIVLITFIPFVIRKYIYIKKRIIIKPNEKLTIWRYRKYTFLIGRKLIIYSLSVAIFTKTSHIILGFYSKSELGIYIVASTLGFSYYFILYSIISSFFTNIYQENDIDKADFLVARLNLLILVIFIVFYLIFSNFGDFIIVKLYGEDFLEAKEILMLIVFACLFSGISTVSDKYIMKFNSYNYLRIKTNILVLLNFLLSFYFISRFGLKGAAISILITELLAATVLNYFFKSGLIFKNHIQLVNVNFFKKLLGRENVKF